MARPERIAAARLLLAGKKPTDIGRPRPPSAPVPQAPGVARLARFGGKGGNLPADPLKRAAMKRASRRGVRDTDRDGR